MEILGFLVCIGFLLDFNNGLIINFIWTIISGNGTEILFPMAFAHGYIGGCITETQSNAFSQGQQNCRFNFNYSLTKLKAFSGINAGI